MDHLRDLARGEVHPHEVECLWVRKDGEHLWVLVRESTLYDAEGEVSGFLHRVSDYTERRKLFDELSRSRQMLAEAAQVRRHRLFLRPHRERAAVALPAVAALGAAGGRVERLGESAALEIARCRQLYRDAEPGMTASNVTAYVIDTGVLPGHTQFGGRASSVYNAVGGSNDDCNGHGTHVAGTIAGTTYGVAKAVRIRGVKVLSCSGSGTTAGIIAGVDWVRLNATKPAVANLSLGGGDSSSTNSAVNNLANSGVFVAVASGNSNANACNYSPASAANVTSVNASTSTTARATYSNYGSCTHLYAPGSSITSAWHTSTTATNTISGTSMASPHVAGVGALYLAGNPSASNSTVRSWIINNATANVVSGNPSGTPNRLLFKSTL